ncbi:MAG: hypothetical protein SH818_05645 [Saprospiraceae bacterium]|nr:hypothetical protein [Saprospiraceae bacterium]
MAKPDWNYIENFIDPELFQSGYELAEESLPDALKSVDQNIYKINFSSPSTGAIEAELVFGRKYVSQYRCDCTEPKKPLCRHLVAAVILYRRSKLELPPAPVGSWPAKITISSILHQVPKDDLDRFLQRYARTNKHFGQALKLHFASRIHVASPSDKYRDLIKGMARLVPNAHGKLPKPALASLFWLSEELLLQAEDLIALDNPTEAYAICLELLLKYMSIYRKLDIHFNEFEKYWIILHQRIKNIAEFNLAPDFRAEMEQKLFSTFCEPGYPFIHSPHNLFEFLYPRLEEEQKSILEQKLLEKLNRKEHNPVPLVAVLKIAYRYQNQALLDRTLEAHYEPMRWMAALELLLGHQKEYTKTLGPWLVNRLKDEYWKVRLMEKLFTWFPDENFTMDYASRLLTAQPDEKYVNYLLSHGIKPAHVAQLIKQSSSPRRISVLIGFYLQHDMVDEGRSLVESHITLDLLKSITAKFLNIDPEWLESMYQVQLRSYLDHHVGPPSQVQVQSIISYLRMIKAVNLVDRLEKWLKKNFQDHTSLSVSLI